MSKQVDLRERLSNLCEDCGGLGYHNYGGMAMEDDLVEKEPCDGVLHTDAIANIVADYLEGIELPEKSLAVRKLYRTEKEYYATLGYNAYADQTHTIINSHVSKLRGTK